MTWQIALVFALLIGAIVAFVREKIAPDLVALSLLVIIAATGLLTPRETLTVFANPAPITIAGQNCRRKLIDLPGPSRSARSSSCAGCTTLAGFRGPPSGAHTKRNSNA